MSTAPVIESLGRVLGATYALAVKTHAAHWNVTGPGFFQFHEAFGEQYEELFEAADEVAERIRALGRPAPGGIQDLAALSTLTGIGATHEGAALARQLRDDHKAVVALCAAGIKAAEAAGDDATADLLTGRIEAHDKTAWMLGAAAG